MLSKCHFESSKVNSLISDFSVEKLRGYSMRGCRCGK